MQVELNFSSFPAKNSTDPSIYLKKEECFLFDVNLNSTQYLYVIHIVTSIVNAVLSLTAILRYIKDWLCLCLLLSYQKVRGWSIFHSNHVISMRLGHGLRLVEMVILTLKFPW